MHSDEDLHDPTDRNLLFGMIALQNNFITREALVAGFDAWVQDKSTTLAEVLQRQGVLSPDDREILERLVAKFLDKHGGDAEKSLAALSPVPEVRHDLEHLNDPDLVASLGHVGQDGPADLRLASTIPFVAGTSLGRFRILRPHAKGGLGQVSVALDQELHREVALKEIQPQHADDIVARERFVVEAEITGGLEHPGIVPVYALGQGPDGRPFYAMRFVKGDSLKQAIEVFHKPDNPNRKDVGARQLALRQLLGRFIDVCNAIEYAHSRGVLHRDLKPGNVMVGKYGETLVVDWGLAKSVGKKEIVSDEPTLRPSTALSSSGQTQPGSAIGTPAYMSPEQAAGKLDELGPASDVYSLGATLYHVLCGRPPFEKEQHTEILAKVQRGDFARPRFVVHEIPVALEAICLKAMALKPVDRYQAARALADDLEHWLADEPVVAAPDSLSDQVIRLARKHRGYVRVGAVAVLVVAVVSTVAALLINEKRRETVKLADEKGQLADEKGRLAERNAQLASENGELAASERSSRLEAEQQLRVARALRLVTEAKALRTTFPQRAALVAIEAAASTLRHGGEVIPGAVEALYECAEVLEGRPLNRNEQVACIVMSPDGHWLVTGSWDGTAQISDLRADDPTAIVRILENGYPVNGLAMSLDGHWLVTRRIDGSARIWDFHAEDPAVTVRDLPRHEGGISCMAISPNGHWLVTGSGDIITTDGANAVRIWDLEADDPAATVRVLRGHERGIECLAISPNGHWLVTGSWDGTARIWDLQADDPAPTVRVLRAGSHVNCLAISPDGRRLVTTGEIYEARVWDLQINDPAASVRVLRGHENGIECLVISPDGHRLVTGSGDKTARVWDLDADDPAATVRILRGHDDGIGCLAISPDGQWLVTGGTVHGFSGERNWVSGNDKTIRIWNLKAKDPAATVRVLRGHDSPVQFLAISSDGHYLVSGDEDKMARIWNLQTDDPDTAARILRGHESPVRCMSISSDGHWLVTGSGYVNGWQGDNFVRVWDLRVDNPAASLRILRGHDARIECLAIGRGGHRLVTGSRDKTARVWDLDADDPAATVRVLRGHDDDISCIAINSDGRWLVTGSHDKTARVWDLQADDPAATVRVLRGHAQLITCLTISPDGHWLVTGSSAFRGDEAEDKTARVWDLRADDPAAAARVLTGHDGSIHCLAVSPDGHWLVTGSNDNTARIWDLQAEDPVSTVRVLSQLYFSCMAFSPDGKWLITGSHDNTARIWNVGADDPMANVRTLRGHNGEIKCLAISPDGNWLLTGSIDSTARVWSLRADDPAVTARVLRGHNGPIKFCSITPDGRWLVTGSEDSTVRIRELKIDELMARIISRIGRAATEVERATYQLDDPYWAKHHSAAVKFLHENSVRECIVECRAAIAVDPTKTESHEILAKAALELQDWQTVGEQIRLLIRDKPRAVWLLDEFASLQVAKKKWTDAAETYRQATRLAPDELGFAFMLAAAQKAAGDIDGHRQTCREMLSRFGKQPSRASAEMVAFAGGLSCDWLDSTELLRIARSCDSPQLLGAALCRADKYQESLEIFAALSKQKYERAPGRFLGRAWELVYMAIAQHGVGNAEEAQESLRVARDWIANADQHPGPPQIADSWIALWERTEVEALLNEVDGLFAGDRDGVR